MRVDAVPPLAVVPLGAVGVVIHSDLSRLALLVTLGRRREAEVDDALREVAEVRVHEPFASGGLGHGLRTLALSLELNLVVGPRVREMGAHFPRRGLVLRPSFLVRRCGFLRLGRIIVAAVVLAAGHALANARENPRHRWRARALERAPERRQFNTLRFCSTPTETRAYGHFSLGGFPTRAFRGSVQI